MNVRDLARSSRGASAPGGPRRASATSARTPLTGREGATGPPGELLDHPVADVVPVPGVRRAGVAQPDHQPGPHGTVLAAVRRWRARAACSAAAAVSSASGSAASVGSMPASASASASSASIASALGALVMLTIRVSGSRLSVEPSGSWRSLAQDLGAGGQALDRDHDLLREVGGLGLDRDAVVVDHDQGVVGRLALDEDRDVDGDLLAAPDDDQVDVLDGVPQRIALHLLRQRELGRAVDVDGQQRVGGAQGQQGLVTRAARCGSGRCRGRTARPAPCGHGGSGGQRPCRTPYAIRR